MAKRKEKIRKKEAKKERIRKQREQYEKRQRNKRIANYSIAAVVALLALYGLFSVFRDQPGQHDELARCLSEQGTIMYGTDWCPHCQNQKQQFGASFRYVTYVNCDLNPEACELAGVTGYPTWAFSDGTSASGVQSLETLAARSGCAA